jgi:hypothetical protein
MSNKCLINIFYACMSMLQSGLCTVSEEEEEEIPVNSVINNGKFCRKLQI